MKWMGQIGSILEQYAGAEPAQAPETVHDDFDQLAQAAPQSALADGLAAAFRSEQTPPFGNMVAQLFGQSNNQQRAGILNTLISTLGPAVLSQVLSRGGGASPLAGILGSGQEEVTPEQAARIPPDAVQHIASEAEQRDPSIIDSLSDFYAQHPTLVKSLGAAALTIALSKVAQSQQGS